MPAGLAVNEDDAVLTAAKALAEQFAVNRQEWRDQHKGGDHLLDALVSKGYALHRDGRYAISETGRRYLDANP